MVIQSNLVKQCQSYLKNTNRIIRSVDSNFILSIPQLSPTSESFLTLKYVEDLNKKDALFLVRNTIVGLLRVFILSLGVRISSRTIQYKYQSLVISHDVINNGAENDFYFGSQKEISELCGGSNKLIYIAHSLFTYLRRKNLLYINRNLSIYSYFLLILWYTKSMVFGFHVYLKKPKSKFRYLILKAALRGDGLESYLRSSGLLKLLSKYSNGDHFSIFLTIEGHSWEKMVIKSLRESNLKKLVIYGYSHSVVRGSTVWIKNLDNKFISPDILLISQKIYYDHISHLWKDKYLYAELRLYRSLKPQIKYNITNLASDPHILILPEGLESEEDLFLEFASQISKLHPDLKISVKWHPNALKRINRNDSNKISIFSEVVNYTHIIYRGTYGIFDFLGAEKKLLYLTGFNIPNTNPLFVFPESFIEISNVEELIEIVGN